MTRTDLLAALDLLLPQETTGSAFDADGHVDRLEARVREVERSGTGIVLPPRRRRGRVRAHLDAIPGTEVVPYLVLPNAEAPAFVTPIATGPLRYVTRQARPAWPEAWAGRIGPLLARLAPSTALAVRRAGTAPHGWLSAHAPAPVRHVVLRPSWRGGDAATVGLGFADRGAVPTVVAKVARGDASAAAVRREAEALTTLGPHAEASGAAVPSVRHLGAWGHRPALLTSPVPGVSVAALVTAGKATVPDILGRLRTWLERWHRATRTTVRLDADRLGAWVEKPLARLGSGLPSGYADRVRALAEAARGLEVPLVAAHHDLTMRNVLLDGPASLGVVDWEEAEARALPLTDWLYAATDLIATAETITRPEAFDTAHAGRHAEAVRSASRTLIEAVEMPPEAASLAPHIGALRHATHEAERPSSDTSRPFLAVIHRLAASTDAS